MKPYVLIDTSGAEVTSGPSRGLEEEQGWSITKIRAFHGALVRVRDVSAVRIGDTDQTVENPGMYRVNVIDYPSIHRAGLVQLEAI